MSWKDKIRSGYCYKIASYNTFILTGAGGAIQYGEILEEMGIPDEEIQSEILIVDQEDPKSYFVPIKDITWYKKNEEE